MAGVTVRGVGFAVLDPGATSWRYCRPGVLPANPARRNEIAQREPRNSAAALEPEDDAPQARPTTAAVADGGGQRNRHQLGEIGVHVGGKAALIFDAARWLRA